MFLLCAHIYLTAKVVLEGAHTANPIWGELRSSASVVIVLILWGIAFGGAR